MALIHPASKIEVLEAVRHADGHNRRLLVVGGRHHLDKGNPVDVDAELWTTQLDRIVTYEPAEMIAVVEAGVRIGTLRHTLAEGGQEWPVDAPDEATVGGVIAAGVSSPRRLKVGAVRDSVLEVDVVTGDGRLVRSGARTVKNVTGYDLHKVIAGSLGTLGVIVQAALKVRPLPRGTTTRRIDGAGFDVASKVLAAVPAAGGVLVGPDAIEVRLEGWDREVADQLVALDRVAVSDVVEGFPHARSWDGAPIVAEVAVTPSRLADVLDGERAFGALAGVGLAWVGLGDVEALEALRTRVRGQGGIAPAIRGPGGLGDADVPALEVQRRLRDALDPNGVLAPGRGWDAI